MWLAPTIGDNGATEVSPRITTFYDPIGANIGDIGANHIIGNIALLIGVQ